MATGYSLHIGVNTTDPRHYGDELSPLKAAVNDARFWASFATQQGYQASSLHDQDATSTEVLAALNRYSGVMKPGDILLLTYAGHGGQITNEKPAAQDPEGYDQTWCLYDRQLLDDELYEAFMAFAGGTRILVVSDSCHSGTVTKELAIDLTEAFSTGMADAAMHRGMRSRQLPRSVEQFVMMLQSHIYQPLLDKFRFQPDNWEVKASVKLLAACQDEQQTLDGKEHGIFTKALKELLSDPANHKMNAEELLQAVGEKYYYPHPNFFQYGGIISTFDEAFPFQIGLPHTRVSGYRQPESKPVKNYYKQVQPWIAETAEVKAAAILLLELSSKPTDQIKGGAELVILDEREEDGRYLITVEAPSVPYQQGWSAAHALGTSLRKRGIEARVEPVLSANPVAPVAIELRSSRDGHYMPHWPPATTDPASHPPVTWYLGKGHSQLAEARDLVKQKLGAEQPVIRIAQIDTGYVPSHPGQPLFLNLNLDKNFVKGKNEISDFALDKPDGASGQDGHGLSTVTILAGRKPALSEDTYLAEELTEEVGAIPFAEVVPLRISDSVAILNTENFCEALKYAVDINCEVVTMSMAGRPSRRMANAINEAYEAGVVVVSAAGNNWYKGVKNVLPKCVLFPAAFHRVIAATGAMHNHLPYDQEYLLDDQAERGGDITRHMQGSWGPASRMTRALAAYTPNVLRAHHDPEGRRPFMRDGGGTSSATPQVAAAAALWLAYYRDDLEAKGYNAPGKRWMKVEAVRHALYQTAAKGQVFADWKQYYGNGIIRALDALQVAVPDASLLKKSPEAESSFAGLVETVEFFFLNRPGFRAEGPTTDRLAMELLHLLQTDPQFYDLYASLDLGDGAAVRGIVESDDFREQVLDSPYASDYLKAAFGE